MVSEKEWRLLMDEKFLLEEEPGVEKNSQFHANLGIKNNF